MMLHVSSWVEICAMMSHMNHRFAGSIPVEGSSRKMTAGLPIMAKMESEIAVVRALATLNLPSLCAKDRSKVTYTDRKYARPEIS
jgi:hypothetical protein